MATELRERLPESLRVRWDRLAELAGLVSSFIPRENDSSLETMALERSALLHEFCDALDALDNPALREETVRALLADNDSLLEIGGRALSLAAGQSVAGVRQRRAITAYGAQENSL